MVDELANDLLAEDHVIIVQQSDEIDLLTKNVGPTAFTSAKMIFAWTPSAVDGLKRRKIHYTTIIGPSSLT